MGFKTWQLESVAKPIIGNPEEAARQPLVNQMKRFDWRDGSGMAV